MPMKTCSDCQESKSIDSFGKRSRNKDGLHEKCKECAKSYYDQTRERINANNRIRYEANKYSINEYQRTYYVKNKAKINAKNRSYYARNIDKEIERREKYYQTHKEQSKNKYHVRRARLLNNGIYLVKEKEIKRLTESNCFYCGAKDSIQIDHIVPISRGGSHSIGNLIPACAKCNLSKHNKFIVEWKAQSK
jgi:5-methylcytosine-specific restriction endonuclease McrA